MLNKLRRIATDTVKDLFGRLGLDLQRRCNSLSEREVLGGFFKLNEIDIIYDVGANVGQYRDLVRDIGYLNRIVSFEPISEAHAELTRRAAGDTAWIVAPRQAVGAIDGKIQINIAGNSASSSILPMLERHRAVAPYSAYISTETVPLCRLDTAAQSYLVGKTSGLLKIDTQGYEKEVLLGAQGVLHHFAAIQVELSMVPLYGNQPSLMELCSHLSNRGFQLRYIMPGLRDPITHELLQLDGIFVRQPIVGC